MRSSVEIHDIVTGRTRIVWQTDRLVEAPNFSRDGRFLVINGDGLVDIALSNKKGVNILLQKKPASGVAAK